MPSALGFPALALTALLAAALLAALPARILLVLLTGLLLAALLLPALMLAALAALLSALILIRIVHWGDSPVSRDDPAIRTIARCHIRSRNRAVPTHLRLLPVPCRGNKRFQSNASPARARSPVRT